MMIFPKVIEIIVQNKQFFSALSCLFKKVLGYFPMKTKIIIRAVM